VPQDAQADAHTLAPPGSPLAWWSAGRGRALPSLPRLAPLRPARVDASRAHAPQAQCCCSEAGSANAWPDWHRRASLRAAAAILVLCCVERDSRPCRRSFHIAMKSRGQFHLCLYTRGHTPPHTRPTFSFPFEECCLTMRHPARSATVPPPRQQPQTAQHHRHCDHRRPRPHAGQPPEHHPAPWPAACPWPPGWRTAFH